MNTCATCGLPYEIEDAAGDVRHARVVCSEPCEEEAYERGIVDDGDLAAFLHDCDRDFTEPYEP